MREERRVRGKRGGTKGKADGELGFHPYPEKKQVHDLKLDTFCVTPTSYKVEQKKG